MELSFVRVASGAMLSCAIALPAHALVAKATLSGDQEVPAVYTLGEGDLKGKSTATTLSYTLTYRNLSSKVTQAHIHVGQPGVNGGIAVTLCSDLDAAIAAGTQRCPDGAVAEISGVITANDVVGPEGQGISPKDFAELIQMMRTKVTYVNVHTKKFPGGEIRGLLKLKRPAGGD